MNEATPDKSGNPYTPDIPYREQMRSELAEMIGADGEPPTKADFTKRGDFSAGEVEREFGSWAAAVEAAGGDQYQIRGLRTPTDVLLDALKDLDTMVSGTPKSNEMNQHGRFSLSPYVRRFGSWAEALEAADIIDNADEYDPGKGHDPIPNDVLIANLVEFAVEIGSVPTTTEMDDDGPHSSQVYSQRFGSWAEALEAANLIGDADDY